MMNLDVTEMLRVVFQWSVRHPSLRTMYSLPNEDMQTLRISRAMHMRGIRAGVPNLCVPKARYGFTAMYLALRSPFKPFRSHQILYQELLREDGNLVVTCTTSQETIENICTYMDLVSPFTYSDSLQSKAHPSWYAIANPEKAKN